MTERRRDPTTGEWRMFASHRQDRTFLPGADQCPLCPTRQGGHLTEIPLPTFDVVVFENRFPSLVAKPPDPGVIGSELYQVAPSFGANEVIVYSDDHHLELADMEVGKLARIVEVWADRYAALGTRAEVEYVLIFENRGEAMGVTLHHPHGQIYAYPEVPARPQLELTTAATHLERGGTCVFCDVVARERADGLRIVAQNRSFLAFVPFAARYPYEVQVMAHRHVPSLLDLTDPERLALAEVLKVVLGAYDRLFGFGLPYVMAVHQAPTGDHRWLSVSHLHIEFLPPHRTATKLKYLAGSELGGGAYLNDTQPEATASALRAAVASLAPKA
ncbi:MAG: Galactose-1-phosphate uridylyltransferase [uncultured Acidimicrobiales bacterium]|uniref:Galactose-1-phosphate uridylyltransferase n=1 Tax=uncultured Acidimicrobiales bacterium TaxID=310071 RepID=A0A6J4GZ87_9ACTN|nr:MAG: Galactose-1-phosphate uridylyltransferase [uncultured Acidimicrobiales bacterium]